MNNWMDPGELGAPNPDATLRPPAPGFGLGTVGRAPIRLKNHAGGPDVVIDPPLLLAPVDGVFDMPYRTVAKRMGVGLTVSEIINAHLVVHGAKRLDQLIHKGPLEYPFSVQISDHDADRLGRAVEMLEARGGMEVIDLNSGCPSNKVTGSQNGACLMKTPELIRDIVRAMVRAATRPVSIKIRLGWDEGSINCAEIARIAEGEGAAMITVHGRTRAQLFRGKADRDRIADVVRAVKIPVIGNGDINSAASAADMFERAGAAGVMVARGAFGDPWMLRRIIMGDDAWMPTTDERLRIVLDHFALMIESFGPVHGVQRMRKHVAWYTAGLYGAAHFRDDYNRIDDAGACIDALTTYFERGAARPPRAAPAPVGEPHAVAAYSAA